MGYYIDLNKISLSEYQDMLKSRYLIPSMRVLLEHIDDNFSQLQKADITNMQELKTNLKNKNNMETLHIICAVDLDYLNTLRREVNSHHAPPRKVADYPSLTDEVKKKLISFDIKTSVNLYDKITTAKKRGELTKSLNLDNDTLLHLAALADVTRLRYVSPLFASLLVLSGYDSINKIHNADPAVMHDEIAKINEEKQLFKGKLGLNDIKFLIQDTEHVSRDIIYD